MERAPPRKGVKRLLETAAVGWAQLPHIWINEKIEVNKSPSEYCRNRKRF